MMKSLVSGENSFQIGWHFFGYFILCNNGWNFVGFGNNMYIVINHSNPNGQYLIAIILEIVFAILIKMTP